MNPHDKLEKGMEFFASEYTWRLYERVQKGWLVYSLPQYAGRIEWRLYPAKWIAEEIEEDYQNAGPRK